MRRIASTAMLLLLLFSLVCNVPAAAQGAPAQPQAAWETYTFAGEEFSVALPEMPDLDHSTRYINERPEQNGTARNYGAYGDNIVYLIRAYDKPRANEDLDYFATDYARSLADAAQFSGIKVQRELRLGKFSGKQYVRVRKGEQANIPDSSIYVYLTGRHAYALRAVGGDDKHPEVQRFFNSFALADKPAGRQIVDESALPQPPVARATTPSTPADKRTPPPSDTKSNGRAPETNNDGAGAGKDAGGNAETGGSAASAAAPAGGAADAVRNYSPLEVTRRVQIIHKPEPRYTERARRNGVTGTVRLRLVLSASGQVSNISAVNLLPDGLTEMAALAASHIKFIPAIKDGRRVSQYVLIEYNFNIY
ncbi:MAG TPA: energy transducer TonB [Pyrinomonadaceae bacterium]|nr:energy transducer TonB [Pyrinomonadaceae bacterium]